MALEVLGNIELEGGLTTPTAYARLTADVNLEGNRLRFICYFYINKNAYENGLGQILLSSSYQSVFDYNRQEDGDDILLIAHNKMKTYLESLGYSVSIVSL